MLGLLNYAKNYASTIDKRLSESRLANYNCGFTRLDDKLARVFQPIV